MKNISLFIFLSFLISCNPEIEYIGIDSEKTVRTGNNNRNYSIISFNPERLISLSHSDSLDLNSDGIFEISFIKSQIPTMTGFGSETIISTKNKLQILLSDLNYGDPDALSYRTALNNDSNWSKPDPNWTTNKTTSFVLWRNACYSYLHCFSNGNFNNVEGKYIGFKLKEQFGWILIDNTVDELKIREYTILK